MIFTINNMRSKNLYTVFLLTVILLAITYNSDNLYAQTSNSNISNLEKRLKTATLSEKAEILEKLVYEYQSSDNKKFVKYAQQYVELNDTLVSSEAKSEMFKLLASYYQSKDKPAYPDHEQSVDYIKYAVLALALLTIIFVFVWYFKLKSNYFKKIDEITAKAEEVYKEKYEKISSIESRLAEELSPHKEEQKTLEKNELELKKQLKVLEESNYLKNAFLSNMSHQIRSSLNGINGFANILETELAIIGDESLYSYAQKIQQSGSKLENLLTNIIDISSIEANVTEKSIVECNIAEIINDVESINIFKANEKGLIFKTKVGEQMPLVFADNEKLKKVLNVLIDNAIKYTDKGFVTLMAEYIEDNSIVEIEVKDTGFGIPVEYADLIKKAFKSASQVENEKSYQGIGIGLKLCKRFIDLMDGQIEISTKENKGTSFRILLGVANEVSTEPDTKKAEAVPVTLLNAPELGSLDIFIVEDDRMNRMVLEKMLKKSGSITTTVDGNHAMDVIKKTYSKKKFFHIMLFDINLPAPWDGTRLMQEIRRLYPEYKNIPFIAQTAYAMAGDKDRFLEAGFDDYIAKPIIKNELLTLMEKQIEKYASK
ncbi:MAG: hypothetical protein C0595_03505 [Marinilabiliales bacterium]|nr:MAG: hypothetical protein C0595_03505 [Marinilabiliales bacterium]